MQQCLAASVMDPDPSVLDTVQAQSEEMDLMHTGVCVQRVCCCLRDLTLQEGIAGWEWVKKELRMIYGKL